MSSIEWIPVGRLRRTRGRRGELLGEIYSNKPGRADHFREVKLESGDRRLETTIEELWFHDGVPVFKFTGIDSISLAEAWEGADVLVPSEQRVTLDEGEYSHVDLCGCRVLSGGQEVGTVLRVEEFGGPPLLAVQSLEGREVLIPFVKAICRRIDIPAKVIEADLPEGLLEL